MTESARGTLRRDRTSWVLHLDDGRVLRSITVDEPNPTPYVDKHRWWLVADTGKTGIKIRVDRRTKEQREAPGKVRFATPHRTIRTVSGGAPGLGKSRRGES
jgi:hypothetical protein